MHMYIRKVLSTAIEGKRMNKRLAATQSHGECSSFITVKKNTKQKNKSTKYVRKTHGIEIVTHLLKRIAL